MNQKKLKQLKRMTENKLQERGTKYLTKKQYRAKINPTAKDKALYDVYRKMVKEAKKNYYRTSTYAKEQIGVEWREELGGRVI
jgi:hypothetical protein